MYRTPLNAVPVTQVPRPQAHQGATSNPPTPRQIKPLEHLCDLAYLGEIMERCRVMRHKHDRFELQSGVAAGSMITQFLGFGAAVTGIGMGVLVLVGVGAAVMVTCIALAIIWYNMQRRRTATCRERAQDEAMLRVYADTLALRLAKPQTCAPFDDAEKQRARWAQQELQHTLEIVRGGVKYSTKRIIRSTFIGSIIDGVRWIMHS